MEEPNIDETNDLFYKIGFNVILSGGISNIEDDEKKNIIEKGYDSELLSARLIIKEKSI